MAAATRSMACSPVCMSSEQMAESESPWQNALPHARAAQFKPILQEKTEKSVPKYTQETQPVTSSVRESKSYKPEA
eukprot:CAMPEP_0203841568 /NCGR_PEP_ID=MMETSP0359-20131031/1463_1 /ASSEMBLY_ACC=CAM_ASM_000338 /TAXON_ID=268821 /ORGANISM="Scrippsiella Hangoei, Strain SHTV-5" /LENGTH=75 /DNA_ID=CAMNT_0050755997 /DNA_START=1 /DNA_END=228 /DNA_ORIENTATION=+